MWKYTLLVVSVLMVGACGDDSGKGSSKDGSADGDTDTDGDTDVDSDTDADSDSDSDSDTDTEHDGVATCMIPNGTGEKYHFTGGWSSCQAVECDVGYQAVDGHCDPVVLSGASHSVTDSNVNSVIDGANCGDTIVFADGSYSNVDIDIAGKNCSHTSPLLLAAQSVGGVVFSGSCSVDIDNSSYVVVDGFTWTDATRSGHFVNIDSSHHLVLSNNSFIRSGAGGSGSGVVHLETDCHHNVLKANYFEDLPCIGFQVRVWAGEGGDNQYNIFKHNHFFGSNFTSELIQLGNGMYDEGHTNPSMGDPDLFTVVEYNLFEGINYVAELISDKTSSNVHRHNTFRDTCDSITLRHGTNTTVDANYFFNSRGIRIYDDNHTITNNYLEGACTSSSWSGIIIGNGEVHRPDMSDAANHYPTTNTLIAHNTLIGVTRRHMNFGPIGSVQATGLEVYANVVTNEDYEAFAGVGNVDSPVLENNIVYSTGTGTPGYSGAGVTVTDPMMVHDGTLYRPSASSPVLNAGEELLLFDVEGKPRDDTPDLGAVSHGGTVVAPPLEDSDVGPGVQGRILP